MVMREQIHSGMNLAEFTAKFLREPSGLHLDILFQLLETLVRMEFSTGSILQSYHRSL